MTLTRRELITGAAGVAVAAGSSPVTTPVETPIPTGEKLPAHVPSNEELRVWEIRYRARYKAQHKAQNEAFTSMHTDETPQRLDLVAETVQAELDAGLGLVDNYTAGSVAMARGEGFEARREGKAATENAYWEALQKSLNHGYDGTYDNFMAWYAGWVQADPNAKVKHMPGYTPNAVFICPYCDAPEGTNHRGPIRGRPHDFYRAPGLEACEDCLPVERWAIPLPGAHFT